jgi:hypothetical protein
MESKNRFDIVFVLDTTASMEFFLTAVKKCLPQFMMISKLCGNINNFSIISYKDYSEPDVIEWSGWSREIKNLIAFVSRLIATGGEDAPECAKTACHKLNEIINKETLVFWYTDACPHSTFTQSLINNVNKEIEIIGKDANWLTLTQQLKDKKATIFPIIYTTSGYVAAFYIYLAECTGGICLRQTIPSGSRVSRNSISLFISLCGETVEFGKDMVRLKFTNNLEDYTNEESFYHNVKFIKIFSDIDTPNLDFNIDRLPDKFFRDAEYKKIVYDTFDSILEPDYVLALSYNPIFGKLWRAICRARNDPERNILTDKLQRTISLLTNEHKCVLQKFIEMSYNQQDEIHHIISNTTQKYPAIVYNGNKHFDNKEILDISRNCNNTILKHMIEIISGLEIVKSGNLPNNYIPLSLGDDIWKLIPSLVSDGIMFTQRPSFILALLAIKSNSIYLKPYAESYIQKIKATWFNVDVPENYTYNFVKLIQQFPDALTSEEIEYFHFLYKIGGIQINKLTDLDIYLGFTSHKTNRPDYKLSCKKCKKWRSFTLIDNNGICGLCHENIAYINDKYDKSSYWCECRACKSHYAVVQVEKLNVEPKCYYCRESRDVPVINCNKCMNKFVCDLKDYADEKWICPPCNMSGDTLKETVKTNFYDWIKSNNLNLLNLSVIDVENFFACNSIYKAKAFITEITSNNPKSTTISGKEILNIDSIKEQMWKWILSGDAEIDACNFCFGEFGKNRVFPVCKNRKCGIKACSDCLKSWYGASNPGKIVHTSNLTCPFCKTHPGFNILQKYNPNICTLNRFDLDKLDASWYYAWCIDCYNLKQCLEKTCAGDGAPDIQNWRCEACDLDRKTRILGNAPDVVTKNCPECGVTTMKWSGCDHITCSAIKESDNSLCGCHWCFRCGIKSTYREIYKHIITSHGGYGFDHDNNDEYNEYYNNDYNNDEYHYYDSEQDYDE